MLVERGELRSARPGVFFLILGDFLPKTLSILELAHPQPCNAPSKER